MRAFGILLRPEERVWFVFAGISLWVALEMGYRVFVSPLFYYAGFVFHPNSLKYLEGWTIYIFLLVLASKKLNRPSDFFQSILLFGLMTPLFIFYGLADQVRQHLYIVLTGYFLIDWLRRGRAVSFPIVVHGRQLAITVIGLGAILVTLWLVVSGGTKSFNLDFKAVYYFRPIVGKVIDQGLMSYVNEWSYNVFGPALLAIALWKRHYVLVALMFAVHVFWFGVSSHKAVIFYPLLVIFLWVWFRKSQSLSIVPFVMSAVVFGSLLLYYVNTDYGIFFSSMFIRRTFFVIANNTFDYYDFFSKNEFVYWSNSVLSWCVKYPYYTIPAKLIGIFRGTDSHVNNTFLSTGYMHAGIFGVVVYSVLAGFIFRLIDSIAEKGVPTWVAIAVLIVPSRSLLLSADLPTSLLTHGIIVGTIILFLLRANTSTAGSENLKEWREWDKGGELDQI